MNDQNRILIRRGARELTPTETDLINGGFRTLSFCTSSPSPDGDQHVGEVNYNSFGCAQAWPKVLF